MDNLGGVWQNQPPCPYNPGNAGRAKDPGFFVDGKMLHDLWVALALLLVIEGIIPFLSPGAMKNMMKAVAEMDDKSLRISGLFSMILGVIALYLVN